MFPERGAISVTAGVSISHLKAYTWSLFSGIVLDLHSKSARHRQRIVIDQRPGTGCLAPCALRPGHRLLCGADAHPVYPGGQLWAQDQRDGWRSLPES